MKKIVGISTKCKREKEDNFKIPIDESKKLDKNLFILICLKIIFKNLFLTMQ